MKINDEEFNRRLQKHIDELKWLYMELYDDEAMFAELCSHMYDCYKERKAVLKRRDRAREKNTEWYKRQDTLGTMLYIDNFAGNIKGIIEKLDYIREYKVSFIHLMPFLDTVKGRSDGGYAVADFRKVRPDLGTMEDLSELAAICHENKIDLCMDFVMNHTSEAHEWAVKAKQGDEKYMKRYFFYDSPEIPELFEKTVPQVFPVTAPGNFTWLEDIGRYVMTTFYPYQWDLNYSNPEVFNEMMYNFLFFANQGIDIIRIDAVPYIWKELGTPCRNLKQVHTIVRMMRMIGEIVCPGVALLGEVVMEPEKVLPYFGTEEKPECHMLYNVTTMATTWHSIAAQDVRLLAKQINKSGHIPKEYTFLNYLRCHDDIGWGLDYHTLRQWGMEEVPHKRFLNDYFTGKYPGSESRGELYNDDPAAQDARFCATAASMCGIERAAIEKNPEKMEKAVRKDLMLHACLLFQAGIPLIYSGDEIGQLNDYSYKENKEKQADSRYIHRGAFMWELAQNRKDKNCPEGKIFQTLGRMENIRRREKVFSSKADVEAADVGDNAVLCILRKYEGQTAAGLFNFSDGEKTVKLPENGIYKELLTGSLTDSQTDGAYAHLPAFGFAWYIN